MAPIYPKSRAECRYSVFNGQINDKISKAALGMNLGFHCKIDDKFGCMGVPSNNCNFRIQVQAQAMLIFCLNLKLMSIYLNLAFVWGPESC